MASVHGVNPQAVAASYTPGTSQAGKAEAITHSAGSSITGRNEAFMNAQWDQAMGPTASLLSSTTSGLAQQLSTGSTLTDLAGEQGISSQHLSNAISNGLRSTIPSWKTSGGHVNVERLANVIAHTPRISHAVADRAGVDGADGDTDANGGSSLNTFA